MQHITGTTWFQPRILWNSIICSNFSKWELKNIYSDQTTPQIPVVIKGSFSKNSTVCQVLFTDTDLFSSNLVYKCSKYFWGFLINLLWDIYLCKMSSISEASCNQLNIFCKDGKNLVSFLHHLNLLISLHFSRYFSLREIY